MARHHYTRSLLYPMKETMKQILVVYSDLRLNMSSFGTSAKIQNYKYSKQGASKEETQENNYSNPNKIHGKRRPQLRTAKSSNSSVSSYSDYTPETKNKNGAVNADELSKSLLGLKNRRRRFSLSRMQKKNKE